MRYLILESADIAEKMSRSLWSTTHTMRNSETVRAVGYLVHKDGRAALRWPEDFKLKPHPAKDASSEMTRDLPTYKDEMITKAGARKGVETLIEDLLPTSLAAKIATEKDLELDGWITT